MITTPLLLNKYEFFFSLKQWLFKTYNIVFNVSFLFWISDSLIERHVLENNHVNTKLLDGRKLTVYFRSA